MSSSAVRRRHVFFITGFDPKPAAHYHGLYLRESRAQAKVNGMQIAVGPRRRNENGNSLWQVAATDVHGTCETTYEYVRWDDVVRAHWPRDLGAITGQALRGAWGMIAGGRTVLMLRLLARVPRMLGSLLYVFGFWASGVLVALGIGGIATWILWDVLEWSGLWAALTGLLLCFGLFKVAMQLERRLHTTWMARILAFNDRWATGRVPQLESCLDASARRVVQALGDPDLDEVLLVGISVGSLLAVSVAARAQRLMKSARGVSPSCDSKPKFSLLTLGHCIPLLGLHRRANAFRSELSLVTSNDQVAWCNFSSPADWVSFGLIDPVEACGLPRPVNPPRMASPRFHALIARDQYRILVRDKIRLHRQYIMSTDKRGEYDYFAITAGTQSLAQRFPAKSALT